MYEQHPAAFALVRAVARVVRFWTGFWSFSAQLTCKDEALDVPNVPFCTLLTLLMVLGGWQLYRHDRETAVPYLATLLVFPLPYYLTHASVDYRQPVEPVIVAV